MVDSIINSDYFTVEMVKIMSPQELYFYRLTNKYLYQNITLDLINNKIISLFCNGLQDIFKEQYNEFMIMIKKRNIIIRGLFINKFIWGDHHNTDIDLAMLVKDIGSENDNVLTDYKTIDLLANYDSDGEYRGFVAWLEVEPDSSIILNNYSGINKLNLHIYADEIYEKYPKIFRNSIKFIDNKLALSYDDIIMVMCKKEVIGLNQEDDYYDDEAEGYKHLSELATINNITCQYTPFDHVINEVIPLIVVRSDNFTLLNNHFSHNNDRLKCQVKVVNNNKIDQLHFDIEMPVFVIHCDRHDCPFDALRTQIQIEHYHSCIFLQKDNNKMVIQAIILKYQDNYLFSKHTQIFAGESKENIDGKLLSKGYKYPFPPLTGGNFDMDLKRYKEIFNFDFISNHNI